MRRLGTKENYHRKVLVVGNFNVLHPGHLRLLRFAKEQGESLVVAVQSDRMGGEAIHVPENDRLEGVLSIRIVDEASILDEPLKDLISRIKPDIIVKGKEYEKQFNPELTELQKYGGKLIFSSGETFFSSHNLLRNENPESTHKAFNLPEEYCLRHGVNKNSLLKIVNDFSKLKICVIGDLIIDEYITCEPIGMSQEDPTIVVTPIDSIKYVGGAGIVAAHAASLGGDVSFITIVGNDAEASFAAGELHAFGVKSHLIEDSSRPTTLKQRYRSKGKSLLRVSKLHQGQASLEIQEEILAMLEKVISKLDMIIFSDFNYGCLPQSLVEQVIKLAKAHDVYIAADSQSSSQIGDIGRYFGVDLITPTEREARISTRNNEDGLIILADQLQKQTCAENVLLKMGEEGFLIHTNIDNEGWVTDSLGALNKNPKDVAGAGDSLLTVGSMALSLGARIWEAALLGALAAAIQVDRVGNIPIGRAEMMRELE